MVVVIDAVLFYYIKDIKDEFSGKARLGCLVLAVLALATMAGAIYSWSASETLEIVRSELALTRQMFGFQLIQRASVNQIEMIQVIRDPLQEPFRKEFSPYLIEICIRDGTRIRISRRILNRGEADKIAEEIQHALGMPSDETSC